MLTLSVGVAEGKYWLVISSANADKMEDALELADAGVLLSKEVVVARTGLSNGGLFFPSA